ncbi:efflux transporter outer membrane subunit [Prolixibacter sp. SD074]|uniref:efflux transporter outer membrane subunit n=1 Tax=Prolixibacter sp. SD074 TaxID=2652391 RepID=UPI0012993B7C|nr:TolC family protein [Prolixibacter sp. SD074]
MRKTSYKIILLSIGMAGFLLSCNTSRHFNRDSVDTQEIFGFEPADSVTMADTPWQELFTDTLLQKYIQEGLKNNPDLQIAVQRVAEAEAYFSQSKASLFPSVSANATGNYTRNSESIYPDGPREVNSYQLGAEASWEVDIWGKLRSSKRAAYADLLASDAGRKAVQTRLIANIANAYYNLVSLDAKLAITRQTVKNNKELVVTMKALKESGIVTGAAVVQTEAARYAAEVIIPDLNQQTRETENAMCILLGRTPGTIQRDSLLALPNKPMMRIGVPSQLLDNRPDVMQAEYNVMATYEMTNNARAYFYPSLTLTASTGFAATALDKLLDPTSFAANVVGGLAEPLFNKRANVTRLKVAKAQQAGALLTLRNTLLNAGQEVNNVLYSYQTSQQKIVLRQQQLDALKKSVSYTEQLLNYGSATYTEVLNAQQSLLSAQLNDINDRLQKLSAVISLYRALGGGWK